MAELPAYLESYEAFIQTLLRHMAPILPLMRGRETRLVLFLIAYQPREALWEVTAWEAPEFDASRRGLHLDLAPDAIDEEGTFRRLDRDEVLEHPLLGEIPHIERFQSFYWMPCAYGQQVFRAFLAAHPGRRYFSYPRRHLMEMLVRLEGAYRVWRACQEENQSLKHRVFQVEHEVRRRLARDLHDGPAQTLSALAMEAAYLRRLAQEDPETVVDALQELEDKARQAVQEIRQLLYVLRPVALEQGSLAQALAQLIERVRRAFSGRVTVEGDFEVLERLPAEQAHHLFYLTAEAVNNALKHANAQNIWVRLQCDGGTCTLEVEDDGLGFDARTRQRAMQEGHYGLLNMEERAQMLGGTLQVESEPGRGTRIRVHFPLNPPPPDDHQPPTTDH